MPPPSSFDWLEINIIANNLSTHEGGGIALDDAPNVTLVNNTIAKNITTATAATNGAVGGIKPANPAGLSTGYNSTGPGGLQGCQQRSNPVTVERGDLLAPAGHVAVLCSCGQLPEHDQVM